MSTDGDDDDDVENVAMISVGLVIPGPTVGVTGHFSPDKTLPNSHTTVTTLIIMMMMMVMVVEVVVMITVMFFSVVVMVEGVAPHLERSTGFESFLKFSLSTH